MKRSLRTPRIVFAALFLAAGAAAQRTIPPRPCCARAMDKAQVDGDLNGAISSFRRSLIVRETDRAIVATALVRMAECYQKLGDAQARKIYERVVRDFADQGEAVALARARLAGSGTSNVMNSRLVWSGPKVDDEGTVSPDGRYISFTDWGTGDLAVHEFATGEDHRITEAAKGVNGKWPEFAEESAISRDGKRVAYSWWDEKTGGTTCGWPISPRRRTPPVCTTIPTSTGLCPLTGRLTASLSLLSSNESIAHVSSDWFRCLKARFAC